VIKADGLAAGKGVVIAANAAEAVATAQAMFDGRYGSAGEERVVIEEFLEGEEASFIVMADGEHYLPLATSQDHKRLGDGDTGPNTGGMGAYSPAPVVTPALHDRILREVIEPTIRGLAADGMPYTGFLYAGIMIAPDGTPNVLEFNCRFGDPETQVVLPLFRGDLARMLWEAAAGHLEATAHPSWRPAVTTVLAARGYPDDPQKGAAIDIPAALPPGVTVFHAGTSRGPDGVLRANGGRVLNVTAVAPTFAEAQAASRAGAAAVRYEGKVFRGDIGWREAARRKV